MTAIKLAGTERWAGQVDELASRLGLPTRALVLERGLALLARTQGLEPVDRLEESKFTPIMFRGSPGPLPGQGSLPFGE